MMAVCESRAMACQLFIVLLVYLAPVFVSAGLVLRANTVTVKVGRTVYLNKDDISIRKKRKGDEACRIEVVQNDPITQRVGYLEPKIFDCTYQAETVQFVHSGSPFLSEDKVKLRVYRFTGRKTVSETFFLNIKIINATTDIVDTRGLRHVIVPEFNGLSNTIDNTILRFQHSRYPNVSCTVSFNKEETRWPLVGHIIMGEQQTPIQKVRTSCQEFLFMELRYEHLQKPTPDVDYLPLNIELYDPQTSDEVMTERFYLPIYVKNALLNSPPRSSYDSEYMMQVDRFVLTTIKPGIISADDYESPDPLLVYNITKSPREEQGYFVHLDNPTEEISSFHQGDLEQHRIAYQPPNVSFPERRIYEVEFKVYDSHFAESMPIVLHIAVLPSPIDAPRVSFNSGLTLLEGQSRTISNNDLHIIGGRSDDVQVYVTGGLQHGQLRLQDEPTMHFTVEDIRSGHLKYLHDDSESTRDVINLKIIDGETEVLSTFLVTIIPKDDSAPYITKNVGIELNERQTRRLDTSVLLAHDTDSIDSSIVYVLAQPPVAGEIIRRTEPSSSGTRINRFTQRELMKGQIYYRHFGKDNFHDEFLFTLRDQQDPPNESHIKTFYIAINPVNENPPRLSPDATRLMRVSETDIALITKAELEYTDTETSSDKLTYVITTPPYFVYSSRRPARDDAGRIIAMHNLTMVSKHRHIPAVETFKQEDINYLKIGYMPPMKDIGPEPRLVRFVYTVQDSSGNKVLGQQFDIDVQPVNNKAPEFVVSRLLVEEGGILGIFTNHISATDVDTNEADLLFSIEELPQHGRLQKGGVNLDDRDTFNMLDLRKKDLRYIHDGSEVTSDVFTLFVSDGNNRVSRVFNIEIVPIDDVAPKVRENLRTHLIVSEGSEAVINSNVLAATDEDTDEAALVFLIVKQPKYGILHLRGESASKFTQRDVKNGDVHYIHSSGEIGPNPVKDSVTFIVSDQYYKASADLPLYNLNVTITPVDNQKPIIIAQMPINITEGAKFVFTPEYITAKDPDTEPESIQFIVTKQPQWGYLENIKPYPGSEKSNAGNPVTSFKLQDIIDSAINYIQATHKRVEPTRDSFEIYATDGKSQSLSLMVNIRITPMNDEEPDVMLNNFQVDEGGTMVIDQSIVDAIDLDMPKEEIKLFISQPPEHGDIVVIRHTMNGNVEASVKEFTAEDIHGGMKLKYRHDDSENFSDKFAITASDGKHEVKKVCNVSINPVNDQRPEVVKNIGMQLDYGELSLISSATLQAVDLDSQDSHIYYIVVTIPKKGVLQMCTEAGEPMYSNNCRDIWIGQNFTQEDVNENHVRYLHTTGMSGSEFDNFMFVLSDGKNKRHAESFQIQILNSKRANIALTNKGLDLQEGDRAVITTESLSAYDESTRADEIVFAIIRPPHLGQIEYINKDLIPISSFSQMDLAAGKIVFNHLTKTDFIEDSFTFTVTNGMSDTKDAEFMFNVEPLDNFPPSLVENNLIEVLQGGEIPITASNLLADDPDTDSSNVTFLIAKQPTYGRLYNRGVYITGLFTQSAIDRGFITYESDGTHTGLDNFLFTLSDGKHEGFMINDTLKKKPIICSIYIKPLVNDVPKVVILENPNKLEHFDEGRHGFHLNSHVLKAVDSDTMNTDLVYVIKQRPKNGHLENSQAKRYIRKSFTQRDLDEDLLQYIVDPNNKDTNDSFTFWVEDGRGNKLEDQTMEFHWSYIELEKTGLVVCEDIGTLPITLVRKGDVSRVAFVSIEVQDRTTRVLEDYRPSTARQVQFDPGMSRVSWDLQILDDGIQENSENLVIYISDAENAILGRKRKIRIRLINAENGKCPQYLGMISKHQTTLPDAVYLPHNSIERETDTVLQGGNFNNRRHKSHHDNTLLSDPANGGVVDTFAKTSVRGPTNEVAATDNKNERRKGRKRDGKKRRRKRKERKGGRKKRKKERKPKPETGVDAQTGLGARQPAQPVEINAPQECAMSTESLLYFDPETQQMYKCNGVAWFAWRPDSKDQQPETRECQQGWSKYENRCFKFINERLTWEVAEMLCQMSYGAHLATVQSETQFTWMSELAGKKAYWIGLNGDDDMDTWRYTNGEAITYSSFTGGEPRRKRTLRRKNCVIVDKKRRMRNKLCDSRKARLMCEQDIGANDPDRAPPKRDISSGKSRGGKRRRSRLKEKQSDGRAHSRSSSDRGFFFGA